MKSMIVTMALVLCSSCALPQAMAQDAIQMPGQKTIGGSTSKPKVEPALIVMNSTGAKLEGNKLTLTGAASNSIIFADRPVRAAGHALTAHLLEDWNSGSDSFAKDPPNATISVFSRDGSTVKDAVVTLKNPKVDGSTITFDVTVLEGAIPADADGPASVFIDIIGLPFTPLSFAGVARRTAYRGAFYAGAAAGAAYGYGYRPYEPAYAPYPAPYYPGPYYRPY